MATISRKVVNTAHSPFLKWAGNKLRVLPHLLPHIPVQNGRFIEPFVGSGSVFLNVKSDAQIIIARAAIETGDEAKAKVAYAKVLAIAKGELAAEALYYDAYFKNKEGKFEASNAAVQKIAKNYSSYKYFGAKGLILMAKNFYDLVK